MKGGHHAVELLGNGAHCCRADRPPEDRQQRLAHLAYRQPENKTGQDHTIELFGAPRIGAQHRDRRKAPGAWHRQFDVAELGQQMPPVAAVAPVGGVEPGHPIEMVIDGLPHLSLQDERDRAAAETTIALAPLQTLSLHALHQLKRPR